mmetsp:Transcript_56664/g.132714  ORF Transcript_56664/g.132714 Transcript_56664/m.132714 type:complete len:293 (+) Transcript_56664:585-1463(+)
MQQTCCASVSVCLGPQEADHFLVSAFLGDVQRSVAILAASFGVASGLEQQGDEGLVALQCRLHQTRPSPVVGSAGVRVGLEQPFDHRTVPFHRCSQHRAVPAVRPLALDVGVCLCFEQHVHHAVQPLPRTLHQRGVPVLLHVRVALVLEKDVDDVGLVVEARRHQRRVPIPLVRVRVSFPRQQLLDHFDVAFHRGFHQRCAAVLCGDVGVCAQREEGRDHAFTTLHGGHVQRRLPSLVAHCQARLVQDQKLRSLFLVVPRCPHRQRVFAAVAHVRVRVRLHQRFRYFLHALV